MTQLMKLIMDCKFLDLFCSSIYESIYTQYFNIVVIKLLGATFRTASNIAHISFTLSRYIVITSSESKFLLRLNKLKLKTYIFLAVLVSFLINLHSCFEYSTAIQTKTYSVQTGSTHFYYKKQSPIDDFIEVFTDSQYFILNLLRYIKIIFSDLLYIFISLSFDFILFIFVKRKRATVSHCKRDLKKNEHFGMRITSMIILNGINFALFRLPSSILYMYGFIYRFDENSFRFNPNVVGYIVCRVFMFCSCLGEYLYFVYLNSFIVQFLILTFLDKNFKKSFERIQEKISKKFEKMLL